MLIAITIGEYFSESTLFPSLLTFFSLFQFVSDYPENSLVRQFYEGWIKQFRISLHFKRRFMKLIDDDS